MQTVVNYVQKSERSKLFATSFELQKRCIAHEYK
jgi:hypothetical protein